MKKPITSGVAQGVGPEFKPRTAKKKINKSIKYFTEEKKHVYIKES
jgi:hypothetical protein